ncbi:MAG TPA: transporter [Vicinamibacterales bacterium]|nr:transporter [Vicinamibacterales bacterium]
MLRRLAVAAAFAALSPAPAAAQGTIRDVVTLLVTNQAVQTGDFVKDREAAAATSETLSRALLASLSTLPTSASSAGFTYRFNPELGTVERTSTNFGTAFVERAVTSGAGQVAFGATWQYSQFTRLDGNPLRDGTLVTISNRFTDEPEPFDVERLELRIATATVTGFATVGVTDRLDVGIALPYIWLDLDGERINDYRGTELLQASAIASATGFGDVSLRAKYDLVSARGGGLAAAGEVRLPTGREEDLLGAGRRFIRLLAIASVEGAAGAAHANFGWGHGGTSNELTYAFGAAFAPEPRLTLSAELVGRHLSEVGRITETVASHPAIAGVETLRLTADDLGLTAVSGIGSVKWNFSETWLLKASAMLPITDAGLTAPLRITIGLDYAFGS